MRCISYSTAHSYNLKGLVEAFGSNQTTQPFPDAQYVTFKKGHAFCFSYGCVVFWGLETAEEQEFLQFLKTFEDKPYAQNVDKFEYNFGSKYGVKNDTITLTKKDSPTLQMLAVSYGLSQSS